MPVGIERERHQPTCLGVNDVTESGLAAGNERRTATALGDDETL
jgi:hypothetical protein